jgi:hypothetical protein
MKDTGEWKLALVHGNVEIYLRKNSTALIEDYVDEMISYV